MIARTLPPRLLIALKKAYYLRAVRSFWEPDSEPIKHLVKPGDVVVDIGANIGWYTSVLSRLVGESGRVYSIEPIPDTFNILSAIVRRLRLANVRPINCAVSERDGAGVMDVPLYDYGAENFYQARIARKQQEPSLLRQYEVDLRSIDSLFLGREENITFIKCDVEGHELSVVRGASQLLEKCQPRWLIEISEDPDDLDSPSMEVCNLLQKRNYTPYWFDGQKLNKRFPGDRSVNYFFLQPEHLVELPAGWISEKKMGKGMSRT